jgi:uncharacterized protein YndB with AHSA1/START domain
MIRSDGLERLARWLDAMWEETVDQYVAAAKKESEMTTTKDVTRPVIKVRRVPLPPDEAFRLFTVGMSTWWPLDSHSIGANEGQVPQSVRFEGHVGGRVVELGADGTECSWAEVMVWQPPSRLVLSWHPTRQPVASTVLEVTFTADEGGCEMRLEHRGWDEFGDGAGDLREGYDTGWDIVLAPFGLNAA